MIELNKFYINDSTTFLKENVPNNSVDFILTSPPYDSIRDYNGYELDLHQLGIECFRVLKDGGVMIMIIQDQTKNFYKSLTSFKTIIDYCDNVGFKLFECCLYNREGTPGAWWNKRFRIDHEYMPIFFKGSKPKYFNKEHMKIPVNQEYKKINESKNFLGGRSTNGEQIKNYKIVKLNDNKCCGTVMHYKNTARESGGAKTLKKLHPATFPNKLAEDLIRCFTEENDIILDPLCGSGTTCIMANKNNRKWIGIDISENYINNICIKRLDLNE